MQFGVATRAAAPEAKGGDFGHSQSSKVTGSMHLALLILAIQ
jgi:hypothetical protein